MCSMPVAAIGVVGSLKPTATPFSRQAYIGVTMLAGLVANRAVPPSGHPLFEEGWTGLRRPQSHPEQA